jgi:hypothetical protein
LLNKEVIGGDFILLKTSKEARPYLNARNKFVHINLPLESQVGRN